MAAVFAREVSGDNDGIGGHFAVANFASSAVIYLC